MSAMRWFMFALPGVAPPPRRHSVALLELAAEVRRLFVVERIRHLLRPLPGAQEPRGLAQAQAIEPALRRGAKPSAEIAPQRARTHARERREGCGLELRAPRERGPMRRNRGGR